MTQIEQLVQLQRDPWFAKEMREFLREHPAAGAIQPALASFIEEYQKPSLDSNPFLNYLYDNAKNRGLMAELRSSLSPTRRHSANHILARFNGVGDDPNALAIRYVGAWFAVHPSSTKTGNFGTLCRSLLSGDEAKTLDATGEPGPLTKRFLYLLQAEGAEIYPRLRSFVFRAKSEQRSINYSRLLYDLQRWSFHADRIKEEWAKSFWIPGSDVELTAEAVA